MESVPHRDFLYSASSSESIECRKDHDKDHDKTRRPSSVLEEGYFRPLSTPVSRAITARLKKSRMIEVSSRFSGTLAH